MVFGPMFEVFVIFLLLLILGVLTLIYGRILNLNQRSSFQNEKHDHITARASKKVSSNEESVDSADQSESKTSSWKDIVIEHAKRKKH